MHNPDHIHTVNYLGSKYSCLKWLLPLLETEHNHFVDVFGGSAVVLVNKHPSRIETYNDINDSLVNFFHVLRDKHAELIPLLDLTPYSRKEYQLAQDNVRDGSISDVERARRFFVRLRQSILATGAQADNKGWASSVNSSRVAMSEAVSKYLGNIKYLQPVCERLKSVQIECRDYRWVLKSYDSENTLFYCDPPYDSEKRSEKVSYKIEFPDTEYQELSHLLHQAEGKVAISGYNSDLMCRLFEDWNFHLGPERKNARSSKQNVRECLWTNY